MKLNTSFLALAATAAFVGSVYAQTPIDITGSTAGRSAVNFQINALLTSPTLAYFGGNGTPNNASFAIYKGTFQGAQIIIRTNWSGSTGGVRDVSRQNLINFLPVTTPTVAGANTPIASPTFVTSTPELGFSDVFQDTTPFTSPTLVQQDQVGVIPFKFFKNEGAAAGITNMTSQLFRNLYAGLGEAPLSTFTGNPTDATGIVYATGRDSDSGSRFTVVSETNTPLQALLSQYIGTVTNNVATLVPAFDPDPAFVSGAGVSALLGGTLPAGQSLVGYLGVSDWSTAGTGGATEISYEGFTLGTVLPPTGTQASAISINPNLIRNGQYTLWGYLQQYSMNLTGQPAAFYTSLKNSLLVNPGTGLIVISTMKVSRSSDGGTVAPN